MWIVAQDITLAVLHWCHVRISQTLALAFASATHRVTIDLKTPTPLIILPLLPVLVLFRLLVRLHVSEMLLIGEVIWLLMWWIFLITCLPIERSWKLRISDYVRSLVQWQIIAALALEAEFVNINHPRSLHRKARRKPLNLVERLFRWALTRLAEHKLAELLTLDLAIDLAGKLAYMLREHRLLCQLLCVVLLHVL